MASPAHIIAGMIGLAVAVHAAPPAPLVSALQQLGNQKSYSWEVINADPGPVAQQFDTRVGKVTSVQQNTSPHLKGQIDRNGDMRIRREWADGLQLDTIITAKGDMATLTPEGWLTDREILTAQAGERLGSQGPSERFTWLRRADRPDIRRPDQELLPFLKSTANFEFTGDSYSVQLRSRSADPARPSEDEAEPATTVVVTMNLRGGVIRDYEVKINATRRATRARIAIPVSEQRIVVLSYLPISRIDIPAEAQAKLAAARTGGSARGP